MAAENATGVDPARLVQAVAFLFETAGVSEPIAATVAGNLVEADLVGHNSHGCFQVPRYLARLKKGNVQGQSTGMIVSEMGPLLCIDGQRGFGQAVGEFAARQGVRVAAELGVAVVSLFDSSHLGRNGKWAEIAADAGMVSFHFINTPVNSSAIAPFGAKEARLTSNPICFGAPHPDGDQIVLDFAVGEYSLGVIRLALENGERLATKSIITEDGSLTDEPAAFVDRPNKALTAFGGFKGFGLGVFCDILAGALGAGSVHQSHENSPAKFSNSMLSVYISASAFKNRQAYDEQVVLLSNWVRSAAPLSPSAKVQMPGDRGRQARRRQLSAGVWIDGAIRDALSEAADSLGILRTAADRWPEIFAMSSTQ